MQNLNSIGENHVPVLLKETLEALKVDEIAHSKEALQGAPERSSGRRGRFIDATLGMGGHTEAIVKLGGRVLGIEQDPRSLEVAKTRLEEALLRSKKSFGGSETCPPPLDKHKNAAISRGSYTLVHGNFKDMGKIAKDYSFQDVDGILFDLGISSFQLEKERGFSYQDPEALLDMRADETSQEVRAADLLNALNEGQLREMFSEVMPFYESKILSERIIEARKTKKINSVGDLLSILGSLPGSKKSLNPATLPFLALRVKVNSELENLREGLPQSFRLLGKKGRLVVISFHSREDVIVKKFFKEKENEGLAEILTKKPIIPSSDESERNPRSKSAKMRVLEKK
ncbi:16S rRNA (cytosine(1402)-N(4))-methyltransferase [Candidatus Woesebacteria bacterium RIFCSPLOWO2_01_FULL_39_10]|uniref:Ribosomal RNA small subunit methyltransferase H n=1 Tax=Candidatus Woesebacteria bacterium RIFCSPLOWO2_01_FULL_39_10 TaxID=1802516 RepID=A0A1F8B2T6_9BACT|nr:MAG: 16S rRNA (cytosine(1402)-N(4))-methyltransferase [Candidatus Woesebacteria bacterium RIFCSPLOWO2_01_FULL_39_10]